MATRNGKGRRRSAVEGRLKIPSIWYHEGSRRTLIYVRRCNICAACAKRKRRSEEGGRPCQVSPSYFLPTVAKERGWVSPSTLHETPLFLCRLYPGEASSPATPRHPFEERERTPAPLRVCWRWRRCRILASVARRSIDVQPPSAHLLTFSTPFPILSLSDLASCSLDLPPSDILARSPSFSLLDLLPASVYPDFSPTHSLHRPP